MLFILDSQKSLKRRVTIEEKAPEGQLVR